MYLILPGSLRNHAEDLVQASGPRKSPCVVWALLAGQGLANTGHSWALPDRENLPRAKGLTPRVLLPPTPPTGEQHSFSPCLCLDSGHPATASQHHPKSLSLNKGNFPMRRKKQTPCDNPPLMDFRADPQVREGPNQFDL